MGAGGLGAVRPGAAKFCDVFSMATAGMALRRNRTTVHFHILMPATVFGSSDGVKRVAQSSHGSHKISHHPCQSKLLPLNFINSERDGTVTVVMGQYTKS